MHLVSHVVGKLSPELTSYDALRSCFPAGTLSRAPKIRAMEIISELEGEKRGPYGRRRGLLQLLGQSRYRYNPAHQRHRGMESPISR